VMRFGEPFPRFWNATVRLQIVYIMIIRPAGPTKKEDCWLTLKDFSRFSRPRSEVTAEALFRYLANWRTKWVQVIEGRAFSTALASV
jgi:hypothetical protein